MRRIHIPFVALALSALVLAGCAGLQEREQAGADRVCMRIDRIHSFNALDDHHVYVNVGATEHYLFTTDQGCFGLKFAGGISIAETINRVCGDGTSFLTFNHPGVGLMRCRIMKIEPVDDEAAARALIGK
jgi:hypothetical protein